MKHMISIKAICPYYRHEDSQVIYCEGVQDGSVVHLAFANKTDSMDYKKQHCRCKYQDCRIYQMLERMNNEVR